MDAFIGEIRAFPYSYTPENWLDCAGQIVQIVHYQPLFAILSTRFGGDGRTTFGIPNLQGVAVMGTGQGPGLDPRTFGALVGENNATIFPAQAPQHNHNLVARFGSASAADLVRPPSASTMLNRPTAIVPSGPPQANLMFTVSTPTISEKLSLASISTAGGGDTVTGAAAPHENRQPILGLRFCICADGVFPPFS